MVEISNDFFVKDMSLAYQGRAKVEEARVGMKGLNF